MRQKSGVNPTVSSEQLSMSAALYPFLPMYRGSRVFATGNEMLADSGMDVCGGWR